MSGSRSQKIEIWTLTTRMFTRVSPSKSDRPSGRRSMFIISAGALTRVNYRPSLCRWVCPWRLGPPGPRFPVASWAGQALGDGGKKWYAEQHRPWPASVTLAQVRPSVWAGRSHATVHELPESGYAALSTGFLPKSCPYSESACAGRVRLQNMPACRRMVGRDRVTSERSLARPRSWRRDDSVRQLARAR